MPRDTAPRTEEPTLRAWLGARGTTADAKTLAGSLGGHSNQVLHHEHVGPGWHSVVKVNQVFR